MLNGNGFDIGGAKNLYHSTLLLTLSLKAAPVTDSGPRLVASFKGHGLFSGHLDSRKSARGLFRRFLEFRVRRPTRMGDDRLLASVPPIAVQHEFTAPFAS